VAQVKLEHLYKSYDKTEVIRDINLDIPDREFVVLVGPSGCGKSTVLRMIAGLETITSGNIFIGDRLVNDISPKDRDIAMVFQSYALYPHMSVYDNMAFSLKMRKFPKTEVRSRVEEAARILDLDKLLDRKPKQLSGGQRQRVALGRAIVRNPQVFLMDEPLSNLDAKLRVQMRTEILKLHRRLNATTIYVTHDQVEAMTMGDRIVILHQGVIQQVGKPETIYTQPSNAFVGGFIGSMYFITLPYSNGQLHLQSGDQWQVPGTVAKALDDNGYNGKEIRIGIRPEHFLATDGPGGDDLQPVTVVPEIIEVLGHEKLVHFPLEGQSVVASLPMDLPATECTPLSLNLNLAKASYFDPASEGNILFPTPETVATVAV
jgi:multiple sugar transport system ATP-binding protein